MGGCSVTKTKDKIIQIASEQYPNVSIRGIARELGTTHQAVNHHFKIDELLDQVKKKALRETNTKILSHMILNKDPLCLGMPIEQVTEVLNSISV